MSINTVTVAASQIAQWQKTNSGFSPTSTQSTGISVSYSATSGIGYLNQVPILSGQTQSYDLCSGGLLDPVGGVANFKQLYGMTIYPQSGSVVLQNNVSGAINVSGQLVPQLASGLLVDPGQCVQFTWAGSGYSLPINGSGGNLGFKAVSGPCLLSFQTYGV